MRYHHHQTTTGIQAARREATSISNCVVSNVDAPLGVADDEAAIVAFGWADVEIRDVLTHDSQRALLTYDHRVNTFANGQPVPKKNVYVRGLHNYGFANINDHPNKGELLIIHGWPAHKFPDASGYGTVRLHTIGGVKNSMWLSIWKAEIDELLIHDANVRAIDIGVQRPIRKMYISDLTAERVIIRMMDGFQVDHIGDWHLDDKYVYELHDQRNGERFPNETYVGEFDTPEAIRENLT